MKHILLLLMSLMLTNTYAQSWELVDNLGGFITDIEFHNGERYTTFKTGELLRGDSIIHTYPVQNLQETGLLSVCWFQDSLCVMVSGLDSVQRVICGSDTLIEVSYKYPDPRRHRAGDMVAVDSTLYVAFGDGSSPDSAQSLTDLRGKILAITDDTTYIFAYGLRNPWKIDTTGNWLYIADVGNQTEEEVDRIPLDTNLINLGWPCFEGYHVHDSTYSCDPTHDPFFTYPRAQGGNGIIGGKFFQNQYWWCDNYGKFGGMVSLDTFWNKIPCPQYPDGMYVHNDSLYVYDYTGKIYVWQEIVLSLDTTEIEKDTTHKETREEREYRYWVEEMIFRYGGDPYMTMDRKIVNGLPEIPGVYWSLIRRKGYIVIPNY